MKKNIITLGLFLTTLAGYSQVGVGTLQPNNATMLDVVSANKGVLIPRVPLLNVFDVNTVVGSINGTYENSLLVFNTTSTSTIKPGYYYWYENQWRRVLNQTDIMDMISNIKNDSLTSTNSKLNVTDTQGNVVSIPLLEINILTTLVNNNNGTYTYTSENGTQTVIDVLGDVKNNFQQIVNNPNVQNILNSFISNTKHLVKYDGNNFTYINGNGVAQTISMETIIQNNQKRSSLENGDNTTVQSVPDSSNPNNTIWKVNVKTAKGAHNNQVSTLGVVKEKDDNPLITINQSGELLLNTEVINQVKEINSNYNVSSTDAILLGNASANSINITLPNALINKGKRLIIKKEDANEDFYINVFGTISGVQNTLYTALPYSGWEFISDGHQWKIINKF